MENMITRLANVMGQHGLSFEDLNMLGSNTEESKKRLGQLFDRIVLSKTSDEIISRNKQQKKSMYQEVFQIDFCPFEKLTEMNWETMFDVAYSHHPEANKNYRFVHDWFHLLVSSAWYESPIVFENSKKDSMEMKFYHPAGLKELILIDGEKYVYGESALTARLDRQFEEPFTIFFMPPVIVFDDRIIPNLLKQPFCEEVLEIVHFLYAISSHDGLIHSSFGEGDYPLQTELDKEDGLLGRLWGGGIYFSCFTAELNYTRMARSVFDVIAQNNTGIRGGVFGEFALLKTLTRGWDPVCRTYVCHMAQERITYLMVNNFEKEDFHHQKFVEIISQDGNNRIHPASAGYLKWFVHSHPDKEVLIPASIQKPQDVSFLTWKEMTDSMFNAYKKVNPFLL